MATEVIDRTGPGVLSQRHGPIIEVMIIQRTDEGMHPIEIFTIPMPDLRMQAWWRKGLMGKLNLELRIHRTQ